MGQQYGSRRVTRDVDTVDDTGCTILHVDMDAFFAAVELLRRPDLIGRPMMVAGAKGRGVVLSATYEARRYGVRSAMPVRRALTLCPSIEILPPDHRRYREASVAVMKIFDAVTPLVEQLSIDEAFLDVSGMRRLAGRPAEIAAGLRGRIATELGLTATVGVAANKFVAKVASTLAKPDGLLVVEAAQTAEFLAPLPVTALWGVGPRTAEALVDAGIDTVGEVAAAGPDLLRSVLGPAAARTLQRLARGVDERRVEPESSELSIGAERTFDTDIADPAELGWHLLELSGTAARRVRRSGQAGRTAVLKVRFDDFRTITRSASPGHPLEHDREVFDLVKQLWSRVTGPTGAPPAPVRLIGVRLENLTAAAVAERQLELGGGDRVHEEEAAQAVVDALADRFGAAGPRPATLLRPTRRTSPR